MATPATTPSSPSAPPQVPGAAARGIDAVRSGRGTRTADFETGTRQAVADVDLDLSVEQPAGGVDTFTIRSRSGVSTPGVPGRISSGSGPAAPRGAATPQSAGNNSFKTPPQPVNTDLRNGSQNQPAVGQRQNLPPRSAPAPGQEGATPRANPNMDVAPPLSKPLNESNFAGAPGMAQPPAASETDQDQTPASDQDQTNGGEGDEDQQNGEAGEQDADQEQDQTPSSPTPPQAAQPQQETQNPVNPNPGSSEEAAQSLVKNSTKEQFWAWYASIIPSFGLTLLYLNGWWITGHYVKSLALTKSQKIALIAANLLVIIILVVLVLAAAWGVCNSPAGYAERFLSFISGRDSFCKPLQSF